MVASVTEVQSHDDGKGERSVHVTGFHGSVTGVQNKSITEGMEKRVGSKV